MFLMSLHLELELARLQVEQERIQWQYEWLMFERLMKQNFPEKKLRPCPYKQRGQH